jgi:hypothetical protein
MNKEVKDFLSQNFEIKGLGETDVILNIKLVREGNGGVTLSHSLCGECFKSFWV